MAEDQPIRGSMKICLNCKSQSIVYDREYVAGTGYIDRPRCLKCGRDKFEERENPAKIIRTELVERVKEEAKTMGKSGQCKFEGCDKVRLAGGYCYRHYKAVYGHPYKGGLRNHKGGNIEMPKKEQEKVKAPIAPDMVTVEVHSEGPFVVVKLEPGISDALTKRAKAEYRTAEQQAAYILHKELSA